MGLLLAVVVHPANIQDRDGAKLVIDKLIGRFPRMRLVWADAGYAGKLVEWVWALTGWALEIVKRPRDSHRFQVLPRRWVVERTFAWLSRCRRLSKSLPRT
jgi:putative transposase